MLPNIITDIPGPNSRKLIAELAKFESPAITARRLVQAEKGGIPCPLVLEKTEDMYIYDVDGNRFIDFSAGFGVANVGHAHPYVIAEGQRQLTNMPHAMGDVFPAKIKVELAKRLAALPPKQLNRVLFANTGCDAVEAALKTAMLKTKKPGVIAFENAYHGLGYGALAVTSYRESFRVPFLSQLNPHVYHLPFPHDIKTLQYMLHETLKKSGNFIGALIIEPILGRGGIKELSKECLCLLRDITLSHNIVLIIDEIYTGFGRTGHWFAIESMDVLPDILCVGKGLSGGFPISAAIGTEEAMSGWEDTKGEAIHTSTFLGNPLGCSMALASIQVLENGLIHQANRIGAYFKAELHSLMNQYPKLISIRGRGLMLGIEFNHADQNFTLKLSNALLKRGLIALPCGLLGNVLSLTPPLSLKTMHVDFMLSELQSILGNDG